MTPWRTLDRWWRPAVAAERLAGFRILVGLYGLIFLAVRLPHFMSYGRRAPVEWDPVGVATWLEGPLPRVVGELQPLVLLPLAAAFTVGLWYRVLAPLYAAALLWVLTYSNSWGFILHTDNLLALHTIVLALAPAADAASVDARGRAAPAPDGRYGWPLMLAAAACALAYFLAGVAKLEHGGLAFFSGDNLRNYVAYDLVRKLELGSISTPIGEWMLRVPSVFGAFAWGSLTVELLAPLALVHPRAGRAWAIAAWGFHYGVLAIMAIAFAYQLTGVAFAPFFRVEWVSRRAQAWLARVSSKRAPIGGAP